MPKLTIVIPTYNSGATISATLDSVAALLDERIQIVIADGGSTDATLSICKRAPFPIDIHSAADRGVYDAMNNVISRCYGQWILFLGSDDLVLPGLSVALDKCVDPEVTYYFDSRLTSDGANYGGRYSPIRLFLKNICHQAILYSKEFLEVNRYDLRYSILSDYDLNLRLFADPRWGKLYFPEVITLYNNQTGMSSEKTDLKFKRDKSGIIKSRYGLLWWLAYLIAALLINRIILSLPFLKQFVKRVNH